MDRQSLLQHKRQRLQELKQRRLGNLNKDEKAVNELIDQLQNSNCQSSTKQVSVAIQVDFVSQEDEMNLTNDDTPLGAKRLYEDDKNLITYDKGIQTTSELSDSENTDIETSTSNNEQDLSETPVINELSNEIEETKLNALVKQSFKFLNKILTQETTDSNILKSFSEDSNLDNKINRTIDGTTFTNDPFKISLEIATVEGRSVKCIDISPHYSELMVASYSFESRNINKHIPIKQNINSITQSPGLAIIYNTKNSKAFPEYFLHCTSQISEIKFDRANPDKVIGGQSDGKVVIWNLLNNRRNCVAFLPLLMTPVLSNIASSIINKDRQAVNFIHHTSEITSINQIRAENNECIISTSLDGVINLWSSNLLAWPKISSLKLNRPSNDSEEYIKSKEILSISKVLMLQEENPLARSTKKELSSQPPAYKFLNRLVIGSEDGKLFRLSNNTHIENVEFIHEEEYDEEENTLHSSSVTSILELPIEGKETVIATSNLDWTIKIWQPSYKPPLIQIPVNYLIIDMKARPNHPLQFFTVGVFNQDTNQDSYHIIEFWDIGRKLMNPIYSISHNSETETNRDTFNAKLYATTAKFDTNGDSIVIGFNDGTILIWSIDNVILKEVIDHRTNNDIDDGLIGFLQRNENT